MARDRGNRATLAMIRALDAMAAEEVEATVAIGQRYTACVLQSTRAMDSSKRKVIKLAQSKGQIK